MIQIPHSRPVFDQPFVAAATQVIASGFLAQGEAALTLEKEIQSQLAGRHVIAVDSGSSALMLAIRNIIQDKVQARIGIPAYACASLLFAVKAAGAEPVFIDCDAQLCLDQEQALNLANSLDALVIAHPFGWIDPLAQEKIPCPVIEDIAQSVGAQLRNQPVGTFASISIGSLYATKPWGGAYGGFISCQDIQTKQAIQAMTNPDHADITSTYVGHHQLSNIHACLAHQRIKRATDETNQRKAWATKYDALIVGTSAKKVGQQSGNAFRYIVQTDRDAAEIIAHFKAMGIDANRPVQQPLHTIDNQSQCPQTVHAWKHCISLPLLANMTDAEFSHMQKGINQCL